MKVSIKTFIKILCIFCLSISFYSVNAVDVISNEPQQCITVKEKVLFNETGNSCQLDVFDAYQELKYNSTLLVDIRPEYQFNKVSVPNSINIPVHILKTKQFLKQHKLLLIDDGGLINNIPEICNQLKKKGYEVSYVTGGINAWTKLNGKLQGKPEDILAIDELSSEHYYFASSVKDVIVINIGSKQNKIINIEKNTRQSASYYNIPLQNNSEVLLKSIKNIVRNNSAVKRIFIYDDNGKSFQSVKKHLKSRIKASVFYLQGGYQAYKKFDVNRLALLKRQKVKPNHFFSCSG